MTPAVCIAIAALGGAAFGAHWTVPVLPATIAIVLCSLVTLAWVRHRGAALVCVALGCACASAVLADVERKERLAPSLRTALDAKFGGFDINTLGPEGAHPPLLTRAVILEDAFSDPPGAQMQARIVGIWLRGEWVRVDGGVIVSVSGTATLRQIAGWRMGRTILAPMTFRRPAQYLNNGVTDMERALALRGTTLFASVKSGLLVEVERRGSWRQERAADVRAFVRETLARWVGVRDGVSAAIMSAILIGDRTGLPPDVRDRLQAAGIYHVLAISGGNIAIFVGVVLILCRCMGLSNRIASVLTMMLLGIYAACVVSGPSVFRAVVMAFAFLFARVLDHRTTPWQAMALAMIASLLLDPLNVMDAGFLLTFAATAALVTSTPMAARLSTLPTFVRWMALAVVASIATEVMLLPIGASAFGRITLIGILLNLVAIPLMTVVQLSGMVVMLGPVSDWIGQRSGWIAYEAASTLVASAGLADVLPWLTAHVPAPPAWLTAAYYVVLAVTVRTRGRLRAASLGALALAAMLIVTGAWISRARSIEGRLELAMFDVGQGEAFLLTFPNGRSMMIDTGGVPFGGGGFDVGDRVLRPALWAHRVRHIDRVLVTHGDPDHIGGAAAVVETFSPSALLEGISVPGHMPSAMLRAKADAIGASVHALRTGDAWQEGRVEIRVLSPDPPDWERRTVRNDDSVVLELTYGDVGVLLTGDISADVEREIVKNGVGSHLKRTPAIRVLKVAHHGSRTSTSQALIDAWHPQVALISAGRGNRFGHPAPDVIRRLDAAHATIYRTDRNGEVVLTTDGKSVAVRPMRP